MSGRISILISGRGSNMLALLAAIDDGRLAAVPALVIANVPQAAGLRLAAARGVETLVIDHRNSSSRLEHDRKVLDALQGRQVDLICLAGYMRVLGPTLIRAFPCRILNIHPSLLPSFPGLHAQRQAIAFGAKVSGCTVHFVDEGVDTGPVILQRAVEVRGSDTEEILGARILEEEHRIYPEAAHLVLEKRVRVEGRRACILPAGEVA